MSDTLETPPSDMPQDMPPGESPHSGSGNFLTKQVAGFPLWVWLLIIGGGAAAAFLVSKYMNNNSNSSTSTGTPSSDTSGLGLAIDPTTGLPMAAEGLVPSGAMAGTTGSDGATNTGQTSDMSATNALLQQLLAAQQADRPPDTDTPAPVIQGGNPPQNHPPPPPVQHPKRYITVTKWTKKNTSWASYLGGIASHFGVSTQRIEGLNPTIHDWKKIRPGERIRVA